MGQLPAPISDYVTDLRGVLDNGARVLQAVVDLAADRGYLSTTLAATALVQALTQVCRECSLQAGRVREGVGGRCRKAWCWWVCACTRTCARARVCVHVCLRPLALRVVPYATCVRLSSTCASAWAGAGD